MPRLNNRAFEILRTELNNCCTNDPLGKAEKQITLQELERLRKEQGQPASLAELRKTIVTVVPQFSQKELQKAAQANQPPGVLSKIKWAAIFLTSSAGVLWIVNLPYPIIRWPVAKTAPFLLLPSYMSMDYNYGQAIASLEQAEYLIEQPTSAADLDLGEKKVKAAQKHLDALPTWFLNDWSEYKYWWYNYSFNTYQFNAYRRKLGKLEAKVFQEKNAQKLFTDSEQKLKKAKDQYQLAPTPTDKQIAILAWREALDELKQLPSQTFAGKTAKNKFDTYQQDFQEIVGLAADNESIAN
jgi:hypothetical protein